MKELSILKIIISLFICALFIGHKKIFNSFKKRESTHLEDAKKVVPVALVEVQASTEKNEDQVDFQMKLLTENIFAGECISFSVDFSEQFLKKHNSVEMRFIKSNNLKIYNDTCTNEIDMFQLDSKKIYLFKLKIIEKTLREELEVAIPKIGISKIIKIFIKSKEDDKKDLAVASPNDSIPNSPISLVKINARKRSRCIGPYAYFYFLEIDDESSIYIQALDKGELFIDSNCAKIEDKIFISNEKKSDSFYLKSMNSGVVVVKDNEKELGRFVLFDSDKEIEELVDEVVLPKESQESLAKIEKVKKLIDEYPELDTDNSMKKLIEPVRDETSDLKDLIFGNHKINKFLDENAGKLK